MKKICKIVAISTLVFVLTGCMKIRANVVIEDENTASMGMEILYSKEMLDSYNMDIDDLKDQFSTKNYEDSETKDLKETIDGKEYLGISITAPDEEVEKILDELSTKDIDGKKEYTLDLTTDALSEQMDPSAIGGAEYSLKQMKDAGAEMTMTIQMPGKITDATIGEVKGDTVTIDLLDLTANTDTIATITSSDGGSSNAMYLYAAIGVGIIAIIAVAYVVISKKKKAAVDSDAITIEEPIEISRASEEPADTPVEETVAADSTVETTIEETDTTDSPVEETVTADSTAETTIKEADTADSPVEETVTTDSTVETSNDESTTDVSKESKDETDI